MTTYQDRDPRGWCGDPKRGAALGRSTIQDAPREAPVVLHVERIPLDVGGYDPNGTYFGGGAGTRPLYWISAPDEAPGEVDFMVRAWSERDARDKALAHYPNARFDTEPEFGDYDTDGFLAAFFECALWSSTDADDRPLDDRFAEGDVDETCRRALAEECHAFIRENLADLTADDALDAEHAGHDFWLTRCGHGAGFWDGDWSEPIATRLTASSKRFGNVDLYVGDDDRVYAGGYEAPREPDTK